MDYLSPYTMAELSNIRRNLSSLDELERKLSLKQLQINRLLSITQSINNNASAEELFTMYGAFLNMEMNVERVVLFFRQEDLWSCTNSVNVAQRLIDGFDVAELDRFERIQNLQQEKSDFFDEFDVVIPVHHKQQPLAYAFIGGLREEDDVYNVVQFITAVTNIIAVAIENKRLFKRQLEQERLTREMELAAAMQRTLIPKTLPDGSKGYEMSSVYKPKLDVGGDYYDYVELEEGTFAFCVGDISGKGVAAALLMSNFQALFHSLYKQSNDLTVFIRDINAEMLRITKGEKFITFFIAEYNLATQMLNYVCAGHNPPVLVMNDEIQRLDRGCTLLGCFDELPSIEVGSIHIENEALILTFTDGLTDLQNLEGEYIDDNYSTDFVRQHYQLSAANFNTLLMKSIETFTGGGPESYPDDFTVLTCKIY